MINYKLIGITYEELSFKLNKIKTELGQKLNITPNFHREVRTSKDNPKISYVALSVKIENTEEEPKPLNINVSIMGIFELADELSHGTEKEFLKDTTQMLYAYLRVAVANLSAQAFIAPFHLPVLNGPLFKEDDA